MTEIYNANGGSKGSLETLLIINNLSGIAFCIGGVCGERFQYPNSNYYNTWLAGHFSDFCGGAALTSVGLTLISLPLMLSWTKKIYKGAVPIVVAGALSLDEYAHFLNPANKVTDIQDIFCYVAGAYATYGVFKITEKCMKIFDYSFWKD